MDEYEIIELLTKTAGILPREFSAIGDDVASFKTSPGRIILKSDMLVGRTDVPPGMTWRQAGRKAVAMCVSDFASKGVKPKAFMVSLGIPRGTPRKEIQSLASGFGDGIREWGLYLIGGDTNESDDLIVDCILTGFAHRYVGREGAHPGEYVVVTGNFGTTSAGLKILLEGAQSNPVFRRTALKSVYVPSPRLSLGMALRDIFSSAMDSSDGLAICLHTLSAASGVGMKIRALPHMKELEEFATRNNYRLDDLVLFGGEEYEIVGTVPKDRLERAKSIARSMHSELTVIGETTGSGKVETSSGGAIEKKGWIQLG
jgi:thiamine-monophosphate kinase